MIKSIIFDFDGLILDTESALYDSYRKVLKSEFEFDLPLEEFVKCVGASEDVLISYLDKEIGDHVDHDKIREKTKLIHLENIKNIKPREGVLTYLQDAKKVGLTISLATSSSRAWATEHLTNLGLISYFDHLVTKDDVENVKPAPDLFLKALNVLNRKPNEAIVFEDSLNGLKAARKAKIPTVIVPNPVTKMLPFGGHHLKLDSMGDMSLQEVIESLN